MRGLIDEFRGLWRSVGFRLAFLYGFLLAVTMLTVLGILYFQTVGVMHGRMVRQVSVEIQHLAQRFDEGGVEAVAAEVAKALTDARQADSEVYLLTDAGGRRIVGNIAELPAASTGGGAQRRVERHGEIVTAYLVAHRLPDGGTIVVGHDLRDQQAIESMVANASAAAGIGGVLLLIAGTFVFRQELERSVGAVRRTAARISAGELRERVPLSGPEDEFSLLNRDITMLDRIESLMDGVRQVSDAMAHNLRTPMTRILLHLGQAAHGDATRQQQAEAIAFAIGELEGLVVVSERLLQIAEAEAGARRRHFEAIALDAVVRDVIELYEAAAQAQGLRLRHEPEEPAPVLGDPDLLAGVLGNLLDNAFKYAGPSAVVRIGTQHLGNRAVLTVRDDGPGVPLAEQDRLGTRFHRLHPGLPGHGLGLASVRAVVGLHGGSLAFGDAGPGLIVRIELPAYAG